MRTPDRHAAPLSRTLAHGYIRSLMAIGLLAAAALITATLGGLVIAGWPS